MNLHHDKLAEQFQLLTDVRNEVKQSLEISRSTNSNEQQSACLVEIDAWERETIQRIQQIAANARTNVNELMRKYTNDISDRFEQISIQIQERQKQGDYLENDIERIRNQLEQLKNDIKHVKKTIHVDSSLSNNIAWDTLIYIVEDEERLSSTGTSSSAHNTDKGTTEKKRSISVNKSDKSKHVNDSSRSVSPIERSTTGKSNLDTLTMIVSYILERSKLNSTSAQVIKSSSSSNDSHPNIYEQRSVARDICLICDKPFNNQGLVLICSDCDSESHAPTSNGNLSSRPSTTRNISRPTFDRGNASAMSSIAETRSSRIIRCPHCKSLTLTGNLNREKEFPCGSCRNRISATSLY